MPNFDKTGPNGQGAATGRGFGSCNGNQQQQGFFGRCFGCFSGRRGGGGGGRGRGMNTFGMGNNAISSEEEENILKQRLEVLQKAREDNSAK